MSISETFKRIFRALQTRFAPPGTWRGRILQILANERAILIREGPLPLLQTTLRKFYFYWTLRTTYQRWVQNNTPDEETLTHQRIQARSFPYRPLISVLTPVYNPPPSILRATLDSVLAQTYGHWELCLINGASAREGVRETLAEYAQKDPRIRLQTLAQNLGISGNSNEALKMAQGEFIQLLDHDDTLTPDALFEIVQRLNENPVIDLLYFDEDKLSEDGRRRRGPIFKPDWSPEMLLSANYLSHCLMRRTLALEAGMFNPKMDGAQDWDLAFRVTERTSRIAHIPKVLYNWRQLSGSTSIAPEAKKGVLNAQLRSIESHLQRKGVDQVRGSVVPPNYLRFVWPVSGAKVSIIVPLPDKIGNLPLYISSLTQRTSHPNFEVILVGADKQAAQPDPRVLMVSERPANTPAAYNLGTQNAQGDFLLFLHYCLKPLDPDWLEEMVRWAERPEMGIVGAKLLNPNRSIQHAGLVLEQTGDAHPVFYGAHERDFGAFGSVDWYRNYSAVCGDCMMMRREVFDALACPDNQGGGGFDESCTGNGDVDICLRAIQKGCRIVYTPFARLQYAERKTRGSQSPRKPLNNEHFKRLVEQGDPYFNPNLSFSRLMPE